MLKKLLFASVVSMIPAVAFASPNVGGCGLGSKLMDGNEGIAPQVLAITTNGTSGNQTFGISTGTSGCTQDGVVKSNWKTAMFIDGNMNKLARDMSRGEGESLEALASLLGVQESDKALFFQTAQTNFDRIFVNEAVTSEEVHSSLKTVMAEQVSLAVYAQAI